MPVAPFSPRRGAPLHHSADEAAGAHRFQHGAHGIGALRPGELPAARLRLYAELVDRLEELLSDPVLRDQLGTKAQTRSGEFSWTQSADAMRSVLEAVRAGDFVCAVM